MPGIQFAIVSAVVVGSLMVTGFARWTSSADWHAKVAGYSHSKEAETVVAGEPQNDEANVEQKTLPEDDAYQVKSTCNISASYPDRIQKWCRQISAAARLYQIEPNLIAAVMLQESGGQPEVISSAGAVGLMQVMPRDGVAATFQCINGPCFANRPSSEDLLDPTFNIDYGSRMLAGLINRYGSVRDALFAYGPSGMGYGYADKVLAIYEGYE